MENIRFIQFIIGETQTRYYAIMIISIDFFVVQYSIYLPIHANLALNLCKKKFALPDL